MSILDELFIGNVNPMEMYVVKDSEYHALSVKIVELFEKFKPTLSAEQADLYTQIDELTTRRAYVSEKERYINGFCTGSKIMLEVLTFDGNNFR